MSATDFTALSLSDAELLQISAWLEGRLDERRAAHVEALLAGDRELLERVLSLRELHAEPVAAAELQQAQALFVAAPRIAPGARLAHWLAPLRTLYRAPMAAAATAMAVAVIGSLWFGTLASQEWGGDELQRASLQQITHLDFPAIESTAIASLDTRLE